MNPNGVQPKQMEAQSQMMGVSQPDHLHSENKNLIPNLASKLSWMLHSGMSVVVACHVTLNSMFRCRGF